MGVIANRMMKNMYLSEGWKLKQLEPCQHLEASFLCMIAAGRFENWAEIERMPKMVHPILVTHGAIETPWLPGRAEACLWVAEQDWVYALNFAVDDPAKPYRLVLNNVDTIADVYVNEELVASSCNVYRPIIVDLSGKLGQNNSLVVHLHSVFEMQAREIRDGEPKLIRYIDGDPSNPVRRPNENMNSYLGPIPYFSQVGIYGDVLLQCLEPAAILGFDANARVSKNLARGTVLVNVESSAACEINVRILDPQGIKLKEATTVTADGESSFQFQIENPMLWYPRGYGEQPLYTVELELASAGSLCDADNKKIGFRRIEMPEPLHFTINHRPVRLWGANWVNPDISVAKWQHDKAARLLDMAEHAHFNTLRVWGESDPPDDDFYRMADERGILIWQDMYRLIPQRTDATEVYLADVAYWIKQLMHHPSIFIWCGGNESVMWHDFDVQDGIMPGIDFLENDLRICISSIDPYRFFIPNSPYYGYDANDPKVWNTHGYTNIWFIHGYDYLEFVTEDTRISPPPYHSVKRFFAPEDIWPEGYSPLFTHGRSSPWPDTWDKHAFEEGNNRSKGDLNDTGRKVGPVHLFFDATDPEGLILNLQAAEALYYRDMIEQQRRGRPAESGSNRRSCGGYLAWKFNDSWPQVYSGKVDFFLEPYIAYYTLRRAYAPVMLSFDVDTSAYLWLVNDSPNVVSGTVETSLYHIYTHSYDKVDRRAVRVEPDSSSVVFDLRAFGTWRREYIMVARLVDEDGHIVAETSALSDIERNFIFPDAKLDVTLRGRQLEITTDQYAHCVILTGNDNGDEFGWFFEDNYFNLLPGVTKTVNILGAHEHGVVTAKARYSRHGTQVKLI